MVIENDVPTAPHETDDNVLRACYKYIGGDFSCIGNFGKLNEISSIRRGCNVCILFVVIFVNLDDAECHRIFDNCKNIGFMPRRMVE